MKASAVLAVCGVMGAMAAVAGDWPQWRGPEHNGISTEAGWFKSGASPRTVWEADVGSGYSSVAVREGRVFTLGNRGNRDTVYALDAAKGTPVWTHTYDCPGADYPGPRATPAVDGNRVFTISRQGMVFCLDAAKGSVVWQRDLKAEMGAQPPHWGFSGSPVVVGPNVVLNVGGHGLAVDKAKGATVWDSGKDGAGYAAAVPVTLGGKSSVLVFAAKAIVAVDAASGKALWEHPWTTSYDVNAADPVAWDDKVLVTSGYGRGGALLQCAPEGVKVLWENKALASQFTSPVLWKGHIYGVTGNVGGGQLCCMDPATGTATWTRRETGLCALTLADGKLVLMNEKGTLLVAEAVPDAYHELLSSKVLDGTCWTAPVVAGGCVYVRNDKGRLLALDLTGKAP